MGSDPIFSESGIFPTGKRNRGLTPINNIIFVTEDAST